MGKFKEVVKEVVVWYEQSCKKHAANMCMWAKQLQCAVNMKVALCDLWKLSKTSTSKSSVFHNPKYLIKIVAAFAFFCLLTHPPLKEQGRMHLQLH